MIWLGLQMQVPSGPMHTTKVGVTDQAYVITSDVDEANDDHMLNIQGLLLLILVNFSDQLYVPMAINY